MKYFLTLLVSTFIVCSLWAQEIKGKVTDKEGEPIKYATIYIDELQTGTSANQDGIFDIRVSTGEFTLNVRSLGYNPVVKKVLVENSNVTVNIELDIQSYILQGVTVRADDENPAYSIMRKAIARAPGFINQAKSYTSDVYIKGAVKVEKIPKVFQKRIEMNGERPKSGETYVNESLNRIRFTAPDIYQQEVISVNNSFPINDDDVPVIGLISGSIYESKDDLYISPFDPNAFSHYTYSYEGLLQDGNQFIDKIKVTPKRKSKLLMQGYLYIVEDVWCLYSYEMKLNPLYVELDLKQYYAPVKGGNYFPVNLFVNANISAMGIKAKATYTTTIKYDSVILNPHFASAVNKQKIIIDTTGYQKKEDPRIVEIDKKIDELIETDNLSNREMVQLQKLMSKKVTLQEDKGENPFEIKSNYKQIISKDALIHDSIYWDSVRPVPASSDEKISYQKRADKIQAVDSTPLVKKIAKTTLFGNYEWERSKKVHIFYPGLISLRNYGFNPVDGFNFSQSFKFRLAMEKSKVLRVYGNAGYAFGRESFFGNTRIHYQFARAKRGELFINAGVGAVDFSGREGTPELVNAVYNLFLKESLKKYYHSIYIDAFNIYEIANGFVIYPGAKWYKTDSISNSTNYSFFYAHDKYERNIPYNLRIDSTNIAPRNVMEVQFGISFTPHQHYSMEGNIKHVQQADWPTFGFLYKGGIKLNDDYSAYHLMELSIGQKKDIYSTSQFKYTLKAGYFFNNQQMHFSSFKHFKTIQEEFTTRSFDESYFLIKNYEYSTANKYIDAHIKYTTSFLMLKYLPFFSNQLWKENLYLNYLLVPGHSPYAELGYTMSKILFGGEVGAFVGFKGSNFHGVGVRIVYRF